MMKRITCTALIVILATAFVAGCGGNEPTNQIPQTETTGQSIFRAS